MVPAHLSVPLIAGRGAGTETCGIDSVFPPDDPWTGLDTYTNCTLIYGWWGEPLVIFVLTDGERDGLWWPVLSGHWLSYTGCCQYLLNMKNVVYVLLFLHLFTSLGCFRPLLVVILFPTEYNQWRTKQMSNITTSINIDDPVGGHQRSQRLIALTTMDI